MVPISLLDLPIFTTMFLRSFITYIGQDRHVAILIKCSCESIVFSDAKRFIGKLWGRMSYRSNSFQQLHKCTERVLVFNSEM